MNEARKRNYSIGFVVSFVGALLFSTKAILVKLAFAHTDTDAISLLALRMVFALPVYLAVAFLYSNRSSNVKFTSRQWLLVVAMGLTGYYLSSLFDFIGLQYISAGLERLILFLYPTFAVFLNAVFFKQKINTIQRIALALTYMGIGIAFFGELRLDNTNPDFLLGSFFIFLCAITFSIYLVGSGRLIPLVGATKFTAYAMTAAAIGVLGHYFVVGNTVHHVSNELLGYGILLAIIATVIPTFLISNGLKKIGSNNVAIISSIGPVSTILQAHFVLGEPLTVSQIGGTLLVITGVLLTGWRNRDI
ncbi:MAG: DMT family transporter [Chitinophagaceae bacterium]|nr:DMT family transporter [Chitinophagaceae bacterium]